MNKRLFSVLTVLLIATMIISPVSAGAAVKLSGIQFSLGSLIATGYASGLGNTDVTIELDGTGIPVISCINNGGNVVPGQSAPRVTATGTQNLLGNDPLRKNGRSPFFTETDDPETLPGLEAGCPGANWTGHIDFIFWTDATIYVYSTSTGVLLTTKSYTCDTTRYPASVSCTEK